MPSATIRSHRSQLRAFTLVELMVAVGLLLVVIIAVSRIFSTASRVTSLGEATNDILQETGAIERQIRSDISRIDYDGLIVIQCVAIRNDANQLTSSSAPLIDASRPWDAIIRCDQLVFFAKGTQTSVRFSGSQDLGPLNGIARSNVSRILYGHGVQLPDLLPEGTAVPPVNRPDPLFFSDRTLVPWSFDAVVGGDLEYQYWSGTGSGRTNGTQPQARDWTLARQAILLADDGGVQNHLHHGSFVNQVASTFGPNSAVSLFYNRALQPYQQNLETPILDLNLWPAFDVVSSRIDVAASNLNDIRRILKPQPGTSTPWRTRIINGFFGPLNGAGQLAGYVRSEKVSPSMNRQDVMLTTPTLATNCSSFMVDWTWGPSVDGYVPLSTVPTLWFGFPDWAFTVDPPEPRGVMTLSEGLNETPPLTIPPLVPSVIEGNPTVLSPNVGAANSIRIYTAVFGFNKDKNHFHTLADPITNQVRTDYTPWPTALRITMQLHDPEKRIEQGRTVQMIIELPRRPTS